MKPSNKKLGRQFRSPAFKDATFKPPAFKDIPAGEVHIRANQVADRGRKELEADIINEQVTASRDPEIWEEVEVWDSTTSGSGTSRITRMRKSLTSALRAWLGKGSSD